MLYSKIRLASSFVLHALNMAEKEERIDKLCIDSVELHSFKGIDGPSSPTPNPIQPIFSSSDHHIVLGVSINGPQREKDGKCNFYVRNLSAGLVALL